MRKFLYLILFTIAWLHTPVATAITAGIGTDQGAIAKTGGYTVTDAQMQQWFFRPKLTTGMSHLKYEESDRRIKWSDNLPFIGIGGTVYYGKLSAELYAQVSDKGQDDYFTRVINSRTNTFNNTIVDYTGDETTVYDTDFKRTEYSALLSYEAIEGLSFFGSYKISELKINERDTTQLRTEIITKTTVNNVETINTQKTLGNIDSTVLRTDFKIKGPALGVAYSYPISDDIRLGASFAYGWLSGTRTQGNSISEPSPTTGQAYGINFTHRLPQHHLKYILALENYSYEMSVDNIIKGETYSFQIKEDMTSFKATLVWEF